MALLHPPVDLGDEAAQRAVPARLVAACAREVSRKVAELLEAAAREQGGGVREQRLRVRHLVGVRVRVRVRVRLTLALTLNLT